MRTPQPGMPHSPGGSCIQEFMQPVLLERNVNLSLPKRYKTFSFGPSSRAVSWANDQRSTHSENQKSGCQGIEKLERQYWGERPRVLSLALTALQNPEKTGSNLVQARDTKLFFQRDRKLTSDKCHPGMSSPKNTKRSRSPMATPRALWSLVACAQLLEPPF